MARVTQPAFPCHDHHRKMLFYRTRDHKSARRDELALYS
jgi:hypothetical protein